MLNEKYLERAKKTVAEPSLPKNTDKYQPSPARKSQPSIAVLSVQSSYLLMQSPAKPIKTAPVTPSGSRSLQSKCPLATPLQLRQPRAGRVWRSAPRTQLSCSSFQASARSWKCSNQRTPDLFTGGSTATRRTPMAAQRRSLRR